MGRTLRTTRQRTGTMSSTSCASIPSGRNAPPQSGQVQIPDAGSWMTSRVADVREDCGREMVVPRHRRQPRQRRHHSGELAFPQLLALRVYQAARYLATRDDVANPHPRPERLGEDLQLLRIRPAAPARHPVNDVHATGHTSARIASRRIKNFPHCPHLRQGQQDPGCQCYRKATCLPRLLCDSLCPFKVKSGKRRKHVISVHF